MLRQLTSFDDDVRGALALRGSPHTSHVQPSCPRRLGRRLREVKDRGAQREDEV
jgi:hypothetical protein